LGLFSQKARKIDPKAVKEFAEEIEREKENPGRFVNKVRLI
jgi:hypothetical protein